MKTKQEEIEHINELYNKGEISLDEATLRRDAINEMPDSKFAKNSRGKKRSAIKELSVEERILKDTLILVGVVAVVYELVTNIDIHV